MGTSHAIILGGQQFKTKAEATEFVRSILHGTIPGGTLTGENEFVIRDLLELHPESTQKIGCGVDHIEVRTNRINGGATPGFWVVRTDGSETDFSYKNCINGKKPTGRADFIRACRTAILPHINEERRRFFAEAPSPSCALTGVPLTQNTAHVDHCPPLTFARIIDAFVTLYGINPDDPYLTSPDVDGQLIPTLSDPTLHDRFIQFHNNHAKLRVISRNANLNIVPAAAVMDRQIW